MRGGREDLSATDPHRGGREAVVARSWRRELLSAPGCGPDRTTQVRWLQARHRFCDLRQPGDLPSFPARCLRDLTRVDLSSLARQEAFAGEFLSRRTHYEWTRPFTLHPPESLPDSGRLHFDEGVLVETGIGRSYLEHWVDDSPAEEPVPVAELVLREEEGIAGLLLRVGEEFGYVRDRPIPLRSSAPLHEQVESAPDPEAAQQIMDFEISTGVVESGCWRINRSTLPFRVGSALRPRWDDPACSAVTTCDLTPRGAGARRTRRWRVLDAESTVPLPQLLLPLEV